MAIKALTLSAVKTIESKLDEAYGTPDATRFTIGAIDAFVAAYIGDRSLTFTDGEENGRAVAQVKLNEANLEYVRFGLKGWEKFADARGNEVVFATAEKVVMGKKYQVVADDCLALIDAELTGWLAREIKTINTVSADDAGKSDAA